MGNPCDRCGASIPSFAQMNTCPSCTRRAIARARRAHVEDDVQRFYEDDVQRFYRESVLERLARIELDADWCAEQASLSGYLCDQGFFEAIKALVTQGKASVARG